MGPTMELVRSVEQVPRHPDGNRVAIGMWDGVHLGHQSILRALVESARAAGGQSVVMGFDPHPMALLRPEEAPRHLQTVEERADVLAALGLDVHLVIPFTREFADLTADQFVDRILIGDLCARQVMVGFNFTFGRGGRGTAATLVELCARHGVEVRVFEPVRLGGETVSSTAVRYLLAAGEVGRAGELLGRPFALSGEVVPGDRRGRRLGFPTANLNTAAGRQLPAPGVYAVRVTLLPSGRHAVLPEEGGVTRYGGMLNLGTRPTVGGSGLRVEVHLFGFQGDLYGRRLQVEFVRRLRAERAFPDLDALARQLHQDERDARAALAEFDPSLLRA